MSNPLESPEQLKVNLSDLLRTYFAGVWGLMWLAVLIPSSEYEQYVVKSNSLGATAIGILIPLTIGTFIYAFHRALLYPLLVKIPMAILFKSLPKGFRRSEQLLPWNVKLELYYDKKRWMQTAENRPIFKKLDYWSSLFHFLYCSSWTMLIAIIIAKSVDVARNVNVAVVVFSLTLIVALIHNTRYVYYLIHFTKRRKNSETT